MAYFPLKRYGHLKRPIWENYIKYIPAEDLGASEKLVLMVLLSYRPMGEIFISNELLAKHTSLSLPAIKKIIRQLKDKNYITRSQSKKSRSAKTEINEELILRKIRNGDPASYENIFGSSLERNLFINETTNASDLI